MSLSRRLLGFVFSRELGLIGKFFSVKNRLNIKSKTGQSFGEFGRHCATVVAQVSLWGSASKS
jgi:hypothetical protein